MYQYVLTDNSRKKLLIIFTIVVLASFSGLVLSKYLANIITNNFDKIRIPNISRFTIMYLTKKLSWKYENILRQTTIE